MSSRVAIVGVGHTAFRSLTPDVSFKEMMYEAAVKAYEDAGVDPREDVHSFVCCSEDFLEGTSISDIPMPDQLGAVMKPVHTVCADGLFGLAAAYMQLLTGAMQVVVVEAHSKASNLLTPAYCTAFALDPILNRPLAFHPYFIAGMEMRRYLHASGNTEAQCALVSALNRRHALDNPSAAYGGRLTPEEVMGSEPLSSPLKRLDIAPPADGAIVMVLATEERARTLKGKPLWIRGMGWCSDAPSLETREWESPVYASQAARMAYKMAGITRPPQEIDLVEVDDTFSYKELQHLEALHLCRGGEAGYLAQTGALGREGALPVNLSGGSLGVGHLGEATGLGRVLEIVLQLRGEAGRRQVRRASTGLAQGWRGLPSSSGAVIILSN